MKKTLTLIFIAAIFLSGCDLFETREVEKPISSGSSYQAPTTPAILFENLVNSLSEKVLENYMDCFVDSAYLSREYKYTPASGAVAQFQTLNDWDLSAERSYLNNVIASVENSSIALELSNEESTLYGDYAYYYYDYELDVPFDGASGTEVYKGSVRFTVYEDSRNYWVITEWEDIQSGDNASWSTLRGSFY